TPPPVAVAAAQLRPPHWQLTICGPPLPPQIGTAAAQAHVDGGCCDRIDGLGGACALRDAMVTPATTAARPRARVSVPRAMWRRVGLKVMCTPRGVEHCRPHPARPRALTSLIPRMNTV